MEELRSRQVRNLLAMTLLSMGVPMLLMGDELRRTQDGNNNGYCHDDATTWVDWSLLDRTPTSTTGRAGSSPPANGSSSFWVTWAT